MDLSYRHHINKFGLWASSMNSVSSPSLPPVDDPALLDDWCPADDINFQSTNSDELEALHLVHKESVARKNRAGQVIQHRAWKIDEAFRSDIDNFQGRSMYVLLRMTPWLTSIPRHSFAPPQYCSILFRYSVVFVPAA